MDARERLLEALRSRPTTTAATTTATPATTKPVSFNGGARAPAPVQRTPEDVHREHDEVIVELALDARLHRAGGF